MNATNHSICLYMELVGWSNRADKFSLGQSFHLFWEKKLIKNKKF